MFNLIFLIVLASLYALTRATHDRHLREGGWKLWAFVEGVIISVAINYLIGGPWYIMLLGTLLFGFTFWIIFDIMMGIYFGKHPLYIGNTGFDRKIRAIFQYTEKWKGTWYLLVKLIWWVIIFELYKSLQ